MKIVMCGIVGYVGHRKACSVLLDGLKRLEYRGYDSAGLAVRDGEGIRVIKEVGKVSDLERILVGLNLEGRQGIGHTRWATHGGVSIVNAHPHMDGMGRFALAHNGIVENYHELKETLLADGVSFTSETDTEVIVQLLSKLYDGDILRALTALQARLEGSYALAIIDREDFNHIYCLRNGPPLVLGLGEGESFCASDIPAILPYTRRVIYMDDGEIAELSPKGIALWDKSGSSLQKKTFFVDWDVSMAEKGGYPHFMLKEIHEQGGVCRSTLKDRLIDGSVDLSAEISLDEKVASRFEGIHLVACGTSYYAALVAERVFERWTDLDLKVDIASEYRYRQGKIGPDTLVVFVSQSGETADTIAAERKAREMGAYCLAVTNVRGSTLARNCDDVLLLKAGPEIGVAATKTFMGQITALYLLAIYIGRLRGTLSVEQERELIDELIQLPYKIETALDRKSAVEELASRFVNIENFLFLGRGMSYPIAMEGALKLKEISYVHAEAYAAGEMKHGPIALLEPKVPVVVIAPRDNLYEKTLSNIQEAKARHAPIIAVGFDDDERLAQEANYVLSVPWTLEEFSPFVTVVPLQLFAYHMAKKRGCEIDTPRNLAKSVTVE